MRDIINQEFDENDNELIESLVSIGINKNEAKVSLALILKPNIKQRDISVITQLSQPEISGIVKELIKKSWVTFSDIATEGKGRPSKLYKFVYSWNEMIDQYEIRTKENIAKLREIEF